ncbi:hypothetical protein [Aestuariivirga sp.]|uniref:hypothetical protein n=1 Tax=Aestuariivirga sp. TaxID=2650926 RepID=UPI0039E3BFA9
MVVLACSTSMDGGAGNADSSLMPEVCENPDIPADVLHKIANIAFAEARQKGKTLARHASVLADLLPARKDAGRQVWAVRLSPLKCHSLSTDGGGFDVEIDPATFTVIVSYVSLL